MHPLDDQKRAGLFKWSALLCAIPLCLAPLAGRSSFELASEQAAFNSRFSAPQTDPVWTDKPVTVSRDPFVAETSARPSAAREPIGENGIVGLHVEQGDSIGFALPANDGAGALRVTAVVTGPSSRALVDDGQRVIVVGVGDTLGGSRVMSIDGSGVRLQGGVLLPLSEDRR